MAVCPVCGCKTQDIDFVNRDINSKNIKICSFCDKQLKKIESGKAEIAEVRWLTAVVKKDVPERDGDLAEILTELKNTLPVTAQPPVDRTSLPENGVFRTSPGEGGTAGRVNIPQAPLAKKNENPDDVVVSREYLLSLETRLKKMEVYIDRFKKMQLIKTALEIIIPIIMLLIILIIFFTSDIPDYFRQISDLSGMMNRVMPFTTPFYGGF